MPTVRVATVHASDNTLNVSLPATTLAFEAANIYARANGYIEKRQVDIGDHVKAGDLLVQITAPELDHQIAQNQATLQQDEATLQQATASRDLASVTNTRDSDLVKKGWVTAATRRYRSSDLASTKCRGRGRPSQCRRSAIVDPGTATAKVLPERRRAI